ncbi:D-glycerate dehydrogenase [Candidatus Bathyarchaeota archaeon]|nr:D-glycerate dehydrogenase [Candidatus Bathyarchaeota archaeon]
MDRAKVLITAPIHEAGLTLLKDAADVRIASPERALIKENLIEEVRNIDALIVTRSREPVDEDVIKEGKRLKIIARHGSGYENVDIKAATRRGIFVTHAPVNAETAADLAMGMIICLLRRIHEGDKLVKSGEWYRSRRLGHPLIGFDVYGKILGIIGLGRIGAAVAKRARGFDMKILYYDVVRKREYEEKLGVEYRELDDLLRESDIVSIHVPLSKRTENLISERELKLMKKTAYLINTSRGRVVDQDGLYRALSENWIAGAALDVFREEPLPPDDPMAKLKNVLLTPHMGGATVDCRRRTSITVAKDVIRALRGEVPKHLINPEVLKTRKKS